MTFVKPRSAVTKIETVWSHVGDGAVVLHKGAVVHVRRASRTDPEVSLTHLKKACTKCPHVGRVNGGTPVVILLPGDFRYVEPLEDVAQGAVARRHGPAGQLALAEALATVRLGGTVLARMDDRTGTVDCPPVDVTTRRGLAALVHHLYLFHDLSGLPAIPDDLSDDGTADFLLDTHEDAEAAAEHLHKTP